MERRAKEIAASINPSIRMHVIPGHFATNHSHVNYYVDLTSIKNRFSMAKQAGQVLARFFSSTPVDTIICMEGTEVIGAFLAEALAEKGLPIINSGHDICVITPELNANNQMIFRDNTQNVIWEKNVLLLVASVSTGKTANRLKECLQYYSGHLQGIAAIFSAIPEMGSIPVKAIFTEKDIPGYQTFLSTECPQCKEKRKIDALVNSYGYSKI